MYQEVKERAYLLQHLSVAMQRGNAASMVGSVLQNGAASPPLQPLPLYL